MKRAYRRFKRCWNRPFCILLTSWAVFVTASPLQGQSDQQPAIKFGGDFRLRFENTKGGESGSPLFQDRSREVVRFRAGITAQINGLLNFGVRIATGSADDPNTADVTLGSFVDDLEVNLDRLYLELKYRNFSLVGGKFANPFLTRTDLVWDDDVNPQGVSGSFTFRESGKIVPKLVGMFSVVDEQPGTILPDSIKWGGQLQLAIQPRPDFNITLAGAYYDYQVKCLANADAGDTRSNWLNADETGYLSDFDLADVITTLEYQGFGERYPLRFVGNYVKNFGAKNGEDEGFSLDLYIGGVSKKKDARYRYGYSEAETDAVLAAFSHDNTTIPTNYNQHTLTFDYVVLDNTMLNVTLYLYKNKVAPDPEKNDNIARLRLNVMVKF
jgi:hypothetical protein